MSIPVFLSHPRPHNVQQSQLVDRIREYFRDRDMEPRTLGVSDYDTEVPLASIRRIMLECNGVLVLALRRYLVKSGEVHLAPSGKKSNIKKLANTWLTSPWCQVEAGMGFQLGLPVLVFREQGVLADGVLEQGVMASYMPEVELNGDVDKFLKSAQWKQLIQKFEADVLATRKKKGIPHLLRA
ncbi:hypothetical protein LBMAG48_30050 [Phycisphaerae bacterium]|nr:hypothetical protein LBMAG48_30050 [Phycisphaerae bacterium]